MESPFRVLDQNGEYHRLGFFFVGSTNTRRNTLRAIVEGLGGTCCNQINSHTDVVAVPDTVFCLEELHKCLTERQFSLAVAENAKFIRQEFLIACNERRQLLNHKPFEIPLSDEMLLDGGEEEEEEADSQEHPAPPAASDPMSVDSPSIDSETSHVTDNVSVSEEEAEEVGDDCVTSATASSAATTTTTSTATPLPTPKPQNQRLFAPANPNSFLNTLREFKKLKLERQGVASSIPSLQAHVQTPAPSVNAANGQVNLRPVKVLRFILTRKQPDASTAVGASTQNHTLPPKKRLLFTHTPATATTTAPRAVGTAPPSPPTALLLPLPPPYSTTEQIPSSPIHPNRWQVLTTEQQQHHHRHHRNRSHPPITIPLSKTSIDRARRTASPKRPKRQQQRRIDPSKLPVSVSTMVDQALERDAAETIAGMISSVSVSEASSRNT